MPRGKYKEKKIGLKRLGKLKRQWRQKKPKPQRQHKRRIKKILKQRINKMDKT